MSLKQERIVNAIIAKFTPKEKVMETPEEEPPSETPGEYAWDRVANAVGRAKAIHFDGCHRIYLSMDDEQEATFRRLGYDAAPDEEVDCA